jgi:hypothetical protein
VDDDSNILVQAAQGDSPPSRYSRLALASFVSGVMTLGGLLLGGLAQPLALLFLAFIPAVVTGHLARGQIAREPGAYRNASMARFGIAVGYFGLLVSVFILGALFFGGITIDGEGS